MKSYANATHYAIDYTSFTAQSARYVRVRDITGSAPRIGLNELEIYTATDTFENYAQNVAPHNYTVPNGGFWVADGVPPSSYGYQSSRSLQLNDGDSLNKTAQKTTTAAVSKTLEFRLRPKGYASGGSIQCRLLSGSTNAFRVAVFPDGSVRYLNTSAVWVSTTGTGSPAGAGTVAFDSWSQIKVVASASTGTGTLHVNGVLKGTIGKESTVSTLNGYMFASSGSLATGDQAFFDDVSFQRSVF